MHIDVVRPATVMLVGVVGLGTVILIGIVRLSTAIVIGVVGFSIVVCTCVARVSIGILTGLWDLQLLPLWVLPVKCRVSLQQTTTLLRPYHPAVLASIPLTGVSLTAA